MRKKQKTDFHGQHEGENVLMMYRKHPVVMRKGLLAVLICLMIGMIPAALWPKDLANLLYAPAGMMIGMAFMFYSWIGWFYSVLIVSDQRLIEVKQKGLWNTTVVDIGLDKVQNINYQIKGLQETMFGFGTILVQTFVGDLILEKMHHPQKVQDEIVKKIRELGFDASGHPAAFKED